MTAQHWIAQCDVLCCVIAVVALARLCLWERKVGFVGWGGVWRTLHRYPPDNTTHCLSCTYFLSASVRTQHHSIPLLFTPLHPLFSSLLIPCLLIFTENSILSAPFFTFLFYSFLSPSLSNHQTESNQTKSKKLKSDQIVKSYHFYGNEKIEIWTFSTCISLLMSYYDLRVNLSLYWSHDGVFNFSADSLISRVPYRAW